jgi:hypothetical protein
VGPRGVSNKLIKIIPVPTDPVVAVSSKWLGQLEREYYSI